MAFDQGHFLDLLASGGSGPVTLVLALSLNASNTDSHPTQRTQHADGSADSEKIKTEALKTFATSLLNGAVAAAMAGGVGPMLAAKVAIDTAKSAALAAYKDRFTQRMSALIPGGAHRSADADELAHLVELLEVDNGVTGRYLIVLDALLREHRGDAVFHGWPERGIYQFGEDAHDAPLPALLARTNFLSVVKFPSRGHAAEFLADEGWHALCFDCVVGGAVLQVADDRRTLVSLLVHNIGRWLFDLLATVGADDVRTPDTSNGSSGGSEGGGDERSDSTASGSSSSGDKLPSATLQRANEMAHASKDAAKQTDALAARLYGAMAVALLRDGPVLLLQASAGDSGYLHSVPGAKEVCSFGVLQAFDLDGGRIKLRENPRLKFLRCLSLAGVVLQAARDPKPSADLIPTRQILSKL